MHGQLEAHLDCLLVALAVGMDAISQITPPTRSGRTAPSISNRKGTTLGVAEYVVPWWTMLTTSDGRTSAMNSKIGR
jgi:hypothetical protein